MKVKKPAPFLTSLLSFTLLTGTIATAQSQLIANLPDSIEGLAVNDISAHELEMTPDFSCDDVVVGLQIGHLNNQDPPAELYWIKRNTGASGAEITEAESSMRIATVSKAILEKHGVKVEFLDAIVPPDYEADAFVSIHADGSEDPTRTGYKVAGPSLDYSGRSDSLAAAIHAAYGNATGMYDDSENITSNMRQYYSFASQNFEHSISNATPAALLETGFLSSPADQQYLVREPELPGQGLAHGIISYLSEQPDIEKC